MRILQRASLEQVKMHDGVSGVVLINFETGDCACGYGLDGWEAEKGGLLISGSAEGLLRYTKEVLLHNRGHYEKQHWLG